MTNVLGQKALTTINKAWLASTGTRNLTHYSLFLSVPWLIFVKKCTFIKLIYFSKSYCTVKIYPRARRHDGINKIVFLKQIGTDPHQRSQTFYVKNQYFSTHFS